MFINPRTQKPYTPKRLLVLCQPKGWGFHVFCVLVGWHGLAKGFCFRAIWGFPKIGDPNIVP